MNKKFLTLLFGATMMISCTSVSEDESDAANPKSEIYAMISKKASEYGVSDYLINKIYIERHPNISEDEIENFFLRYAKMDGTYLASNVKKSTSQKVYKCAMIFAKCVLALILWTTNNVITLLNTETTKNPMKMLFKIQENTIFQQR